MSLILPFKAFRRAETGIASVEFALLSTVLLLFFVGGFDLVYMVTAKRDSDRASTLIAHAMATCQTSSCMSDFITIYLQRRTNALIRYPNATVELYMIQKKNGVIKPCSGKSQTLTDSKVMASALNLFRDNDVGSAVTLTTSYKSIIPNAAQAYISLTGQSYSGSTVDVMGNIGAVC